MRSRLRTRAFALIGASLFGVMLASCSGSTTTLPQTAQPQTVPTATAQPGNSAINQSPAALTVISVTSTDRSAAATAASFHVHYLSVKKHGSSGITAQSLVHASNVAYFGGPTLTSAQIFNAFVDSTPAMFGDVAQFEQRLSRSTMIHMTDAYVGATAGNRYDWKRDVAVNYPIYAILGDNDLLSILHAVATGVAGGGLKHVYNIFLPPSVTYCDPFGNCSANETSANPAYCAFHGDVRFSDIGDTLFTLQPYVDPNFCGVDAFAQQPFGPTPNGVQQDSTYSLVSHEEFETITDPVVPTGWLNPDGFYPMEIGDLCAFVNGQFNSSGFIVPENTKLYGKLYRIQFEYSNKQLGCNNSPP